MKAMPLLLAATLAFGCGGKSASVKTGPTSALTVAEWKALPVEQKYEPATIERLKLADPKLETSEGWEAFNRSTLLPERKKDFPGGQKPR